MDTPEVDATKGKKSLRQSIQGKILPVVGGVLLGAAVPVWQTYWVEQPLLSVEINGVTKDTSIVLAAEPELKPLYDYTRHSFGYSDPEREDVPKPVSAKQLNAMIKSLKSELPPVTDRFSQVTKTRSDLDGIRPMDLTRQQVEQYNNTVFFPDQVDLKEFATMREDATKHEQYFTELLERLKKKYTNYISGAQQRLESLKAAILDDEVVERVKMEHSFFKISAALTNSGRTSISVKEPALLRVYIGRGNYVDLKLRLESYETAEEITARGTRVVSFRSEEVSTLPKDDQDLINSHWNQNVHAVLFVEDILGYVHSSNAIAFAESVSQKIVYDHLALEASKPKYFER